MVLEKMVMLESGRSVKVIVQRQSQNSQGKIALDVLVKEPREDYFHPPIGPSHPQFWKLKKLGVEEAKLLQLNYSGLSAKQLRKLVEEIRQEIGCDVYQV